MRRRTVLAGAVIPLVLVLTACNAAPAPSSAPPKKATMAVTTDSSWAWLKPNANGVSWR